MNLARVEFMIVLLGGAVVAATGRSSLLSATSAAGGALLGWLSFVGVRAFSVRLVGRRVGRERAMALTLLKWCLVAGALGFLFWWRPDVDGLALAAGVSCLPLAIVAETIFLVYRRRTNGAQLHLGG